MSHMGTTLTIRTSDDLRKTLQERALARGQSVSELVREILELALADRPLGGRLGHLRGTLDLPSAPSGDPWTQQLRERNWR